MAVGQNLLFGRMKQKIGGIVTSTWKGINVIKSKPLTVANPKTDLQLMRRSALIQIVALARSIVAALQIGFKEQAVFKSAFNAFTGYNMRNAFDYTAPPAATIDYQLIKVAQGTITQTNLTSMVIDDSANTAVFDWSVGPLQPGQSAGDILVFAIVNINTGVNQALVTSTPRSAGTLTESTVPFVYTAGDVVYVYTFFYNVASRKASDSAMTQVTVVV